MTAPRIIWGEEAASTTAGGQHGRAVPGHQRQAEARAPRGDEREPAERAGGQEEIVEALIERERLRALRLLRGAAKAPVDGRLRPPETLHAEEQNVDDPGQSGSGPHDDEHVSDLLGPSRRGSGSSSSPENEIERADLATLDVPDLHHELGIEDAVTLIGRLPREIELGGEGGPTGRLHLDVD